jgi:hypothetical protein
VTGPHRPQCWSPPCHCLHMSCMRESGRKRRTCPHLPIALLFACPPTTTTLPTQSAQRLDGQWFPVSGDSTGAGPASFKATVQQIPVDYGTSVSCHASKLLQIGGVVQEEGKAVGAGLCSSTWVVQSRAPTISTPFSSLVAFPFPPRNNALPASMPSCHALQSKAHQSWMRPWLV